MSWIREKSLNWLQLLCVKVIRSGGVPKHVAFIMDGNRRYAEKNKVEKIEGHTKGDKLMEHGVCVRVIGNLALLPEDIRKLIAEAMFITKENNKAFLNVAFSYTARDEITNAVKSIVAGVERKVLLPSDISQELITNSLYTNNSPNPELVIRTSGEVRLSDFLLWQISCSCIYFTKVLWPEFTFWHMLAAVFYYQRCKEDLVDINRFEANVSAPSNCRIDTFLTELNAYRTAKSEEVGQVVA
ncbi:dehydrodolichyl diphosphate synthase complex subunit DHDDS isoform X3 [Anabrus simplex]|uniref:dehydrodolichyl diphosphate synthase complex subunit DHDDS isoform X3 n=1 Tax=Anabrus simplex TaxID=316456 RepID=UPI0034DD61CB